MSQKTLRAELTARLHEALVAADLPTEGAEVVPAADTRFGDYQSNVAMTLAKAQKTNPRQLAQTILEKFSVADLSDPPTLAGAGFINFLITLPALGERLIALAKDERLGVPFAEKSKTILIDFSSPNVAKPMHVGHVRSTVIGDCLTRVARALGHTVITDNHIGDWGTQFGKVIYGWKHFLDPAALERDPLAELVRLYREVNVLEETDETVKRIAREEVVKVQQGDPENLAIWQQTIELSYGECQKIYDLLDVKFDERLGESFYNDALAPLCERLAKSGLAEKSEGALCIFFRDIPALADKPLIIQKSNGGFLYSTTDLAALEYRLARWHPDEIWVVVGAPQALYFQQLIAASERLGMPSKLRHVAFGSILGEDRKMMKTRSGENVALADLLKESMDRAVRLIREKNPEMPEAEALETARMIGIGAVKYAELSQHRMTDYIFSWDKMLSFQGNTAPYLQNAYVRIRSIFRKLDGETVSFDAPPEFTAPQERALALKMLQYGETLPLVLTDFRPNLLANYLYELADTYHGFYEACPVLKSEGSVRSTRLLLSELTARILRSGLGLMGIHCPERM